MGLDEGPTMKPEPQLSVVAFRYKSDNDANRALLERINARKRVMLTPTTVGGQFVIRICVVSFRTHRDRMEMALEDIRESVHSLFGSATNPRGSPSETGGVPTT